MNEKNFEYIPKWVRKDVKVKIFYKDKWYSGTITSTPNENDRGVEVKTKKYPVLSIPVYMCFRSQEQWNKLLIRED